MKLSLKPIKLELRVNWKLSRNEALFKDNFVIEIESQGQIGQGEIAPNIRYGETPENIKEAFDALPSFNDSNEVVEYCDGRNLLHAFKCGLVNAAIDLKSKLEGKSIEEGLGLKSLGPAPTSMSVPIMEENLLEEYVTSISRFPFIKIKVNADNAISFSRKVCLVVHFI